MSDNKHIVLGDFQGNFLTTQPSLLSLKEYSSSSPDFNLQVYRGSIENAEKLTAYQPELHRIPESLILYNVDKITIHPSSNWPASECGEYTFNQLMIINPTIGKTWRNNGKTYGLIEGKAIGVVNMPEFDKKRVGAWYEKDWVKFVWNIIKWLLLFLLLFLLLRQCDSRINTEDCEDLVLQRDSLLKESDQNTEIIKQLRDKLEKQEREYRDITDEVEDRRIKEGGKRGDVTITLVWNTKDDLDLSVVEPNGDKIWFSKPHSNSGGYLDIDKNHSSLDLTNSPVENIFWNEIPAAGKYRVYVTLYEKRTENKEIEFKVRIRKDGEVKDYIKTIEKPNKTLQITTFDIETET